MKDIDIIKAEMAPYIDEYGMVTADKEHKHKGDALHKSGLYYGGLAILGELTPEEEKAFGDGLEANMNDDDTLMRHYRETPNTRDQHTTVFLALYMMPGLAKTNDKLLKRIEKTAPLYMTGKDVNIPDHWVFFARCSRHKISTWSKYLADFFFVIGVLLTIYNTKKALKKAEEENLWHAMSPYSDILLRYIKAWVNKTEQPTFLSKYAWSLFEKDKMIKGFIHYFTKWWEQAPVHMVWVKLISEDKL